ncbi:MAG TPA: signal recognition particle protein, partial [Vicinamibacteria bacterium]
IPGLGNAAREVDTEAGEREMKRAVAIIDYMTPPESRDPSIINGSRRKRIAKGSGTSVEDVNRLLKNFVQARKLMKQFGGGGSKMLKRLMGGRMPQFR